MFTFKTLDLKRIIVIIIILIMLFVLSSCIINSLDIGGFNNKEEIIALIKENIDDLNELTQEIYNKFNNGNKFYIIIENKTFKTFNHSFEYKTLLSYRVFNKFKIDFIAVHYDEKRVKYSVRTKFGTYVGFYYDLNDNKNYEGGTALKTGKLTSYFELKEKTALLWQFKSGWYTEKISDNWYYYEDDWEYLNLIKYIYDDIINIGTLSEYHQKYKHSFEKYNPHNSATASVIKE